MSDNRHFDQLVAAGNPVGEVIGVNSFMVQVKGLHPISIQALVMFEDGSKGFVEHILDNYVVVLHLGAQPLAVGTTAVKQHDELVTRVGKEFVGRVISATGQPIDGKGPIAADGVWPVFAEAPMLYKRELLNTQLETGVTVVDALFPLVRGQRIAILGDSKSGKTTLATQLTLNQRNTDVVVIYVLIAKRHSDVDALISQLEAADALKTAIVIVSMMSESLVESYLAPYIGCALGEYLWQNCNQDVVVVYDDLTSHAHVYREITLLSGVSPGRDSYPGDIFYAHSSLMERAGKLASNHKTLTAIPLVLTPGGDITAYLPTNIMSMTDGQWILDMKVFRNTIRPALNVGLSVTRVGGRGQNARQQQQGVQALKTLAAYEQASEFSHFGSEMAVSAQKELERGKYLYELFTQKPSEAYSLTSQQLMLEVLLNIDDTQIPNVPAIKIHATELAAKIKTDENYKKAVDQLKTFGLVQRTNQPQATQAEPAKPPAEPEEAKK